MNKKLIEFIVCACITILIFGWDYYKIKHGKYNIPVGSDTHYTGRWRWVYNWGWAILGITIIKLTEFIGTI